MLNISNNKIITVTRGDSFSLVFRFIELVGNDEGTNTVEELNLRDDVVYLGVMEPNQPFEHALIRKTGDIDFETGEVSFEFRPEDTEHVLPGHYYYSVKVGSDFDIQDPPQPTKVDTLIKKTKFNIID